MRGHGAAKKIRPTPNLSEFPITPTPPFETLPDMLPVGVEVIPAIGLEIQATATFKLGLPQFL